MEEVNLGFSQLKFAPGYVVAQACEGADIDIEHHLMVIDELEKRNDGDYAMILDEVNSYSIRLSTLMECRRNKRLKCIAVIGCRQSTIEMAAVSAAGIIKPVKVFETIPAAQEWVLAQLNQDIS